MKSNHQHLQNELDDLTSSVDHQTLVTWAALCANHVLFYFTHVFKEDQRPEKAILTANQWVDGKTDVQEARKQSFEAHAAARSSSNPSATFAARAAGHAAATVHVKTHAVHAAKYAIKAVAHTKDAVLMLEELKWQIETLTNLIKTSQ